MDERALNRMVVEARERAEAREDKDFEKVVRAVGKKLDMLHPLRKVRVCLGCDRPFRSRGPENRICRHCAEVDDRRGGSLSYQERATIRKLLDLEDAEIVEALKDDDDHAPEAEAMHIVTEDEE